MKDKRYKKKSKGTNVRLSDSLYLTLKKLAEDKGYSITKYVEIAVTEKINDEI